MVVWLKTSATQRNKSVCVLNKTKQNHPRRSETNRKMKAMAQFGAIISYKIGYLKLKYFISFCDKVKRQEFVQISNLKMNSLT